jgi:hypothetical protein
MAHVWPPPIATAVNAGVVAVAAGANGKTSIAAARSETESVDRRCIIIVPP